MANRIKRLRMEKARMEREALFRQLLAEQKQKAKKVKLTPTVAQQLEAADYQFKTLPVALRKKRIAHLCDGFQKFLESPKGERKDLYQETAKKALLLEVLRNKGLRKVIDKFLFRYIANIIHSCEIIRPIAEWKAPNISDPYKLCWSFFQYACVKYPDQFPRCLKQTFFYDAFHYISSFDEEKQKWICKYYELNLLFHFAAGHGLQTYTEKHSYSGKMNYFFHRLPDSIEYPYDGLMWAALAAWGIPVNFIENLIEDLTKEQVMQSEDLYRFLARQPGISLEMMRRIQTFYRHQKFEKAHVFSKEIDPLFPDLSFKKRTIKSVLRLVQKWDKWLELQKSEVLNSKLIISPKNDFKLEQYSIEQLTVPAAIIEEGEAMKHCVADQYLQSCVEGKMSIWSVWETTPGTGIKKRLATIAVTDDNIIEEFKGKCNMEPLHRVKQVVAKWTKEEEINNNDFV